MSRLLSTILMTWLNHAQTITENYKEVSMLSLDLPHQWGPLWASLMLLRTTFLPDHVMQAHRHHPNGITIITCMLSHHQSYLLLIGVDWCHVAGKPMSSSTVFRFTLCENAYICVEDNYMHAHVYIYNVHAYTCAHTVYQKLTCLKVHHKCHHHTIQLSQSQSVMCAHTN